MNKILRYSLLSIMMVFCGSMFAQNVIWQEDWTGWEPKTAVNGVKANYTFGGQVLNDDGTHKSGTTIYDESLAGGTAPELLIAKSGGYFTANIALNGASGNLTLRFKSNKNLTVTAEGATVGEVVNTGNDYSYPITVSAGTSQISITFTMAQSSNARFDDVKLFSGEAKKPAGLSWGTASRTVTIGSADNQFPTLSNENNLPVTYSSSDTGVATIDGSGNITLVAAGKTTITAEFAGNNEYEAASVSYELTVKDAAPTGKGMEATNPFTVAEALTFMSTLGVNEKTDYDVYVKGYITQIDEVSTDHGNATYYIGDTGTRAAGANDLYVFRGKYLGGENFSAADQIAEGDAVVVFGKVVNYRSSSASDADPVTPEFAQGSKIYSLNGQTAGVNALTVSELNVNAPMYNVAGQRVSAEYKGVVLQNGKKFINK